VVNVTAVVGNICTVILTIRTSTANRNCFVCVPGARKPALVMAIVHCLDLGTTSCEDKSNTFVTMHSFFCVELV